MYIVMITDIVFSTTNRAEACGYAKHLARDCGAATSVFKLGRRETLVAEFDPDLGQTY